MMVSDRNLCRKQPIASIILVQLSVPSVNPRVIPSVKTMVHQVEEVQCDAEVWDLAMVWVEEVERRMLVEVEIQVEAVIVGEIKCLGTRSSFKSSLYFIFFLCVSVCVNTLKKAKIVVFLSIRSFEEKNSSRMSLLIGLFFPCVTVGFSFYSLLFALYHCHCSSTELKKKISIKDNDSTPN